MAKAMLMFEMTKDRSNRPTGHDTEGLNLKVRSQKSLNDHKNKKLKKKEMSKFHTKLKSPIFFDLLKMGSKVSFSLTYKVKLFPK